MKKLWCLLALLALTPAFAQDIPLTVKGDVKIVTVAKKLPVSVEAPKGAHFYFWSYPTGPGYEYAGGDRRDQTLEIKKAPKGEMIVKCEMWTVDFDKKDVTGKTAQVTFVIGEIPPEPGPDPPKPDPPKPDPPKPVTKLNVVLITDAQADWGPRLNVLKDVLTALKSAGHNAWRREDNQAAAKDYVDYLKSKNIKLPAAVLMAQDGIRAAVSLPEPLTVAACLKIITDAGGIGGQSEILTDADGKTYVEFNGQRRYLAAFQTPLATKRLFAKYGDTFNLIPESQWVDWSIGDVAQLRILDQDGYSACVGHGAAAAFELAWRLNIRPSAKFNAWFNYGLINGGSDGGAMVGDALLAMQKYGTCLEGTVPYGEWRKSRFPQKAYDEAARFKPEVAYWCRSWDEIVSAALRGHPVVFGCGIGSRFTPDARGVIPAQSGYGGGHCMAVIGVKKFGTTWYVHVQNSWGADWGLAGTCYMPKSYFREGDVSDSFAVVAPAEDPFDPTPLPKIPAVKIDAPHTVELKTETGYAAPAFQRTIYFNPFGGRLLRR